MFRRHMVRGGLDGEREFKWRGGEITRLESFSDAVFAFAVTLLVVSLEVPKTYPELMHAMRGFLAFGVCFALLVIVWYQHYRFFRRYALQDTWVVVLNSLLLFFVLFYVYPLKFLFASSFNGGVVLDDHAARTLFVIFGLGYCAVFSVFSLLYLYALTQRHELALTRFELIATRHGLLHHVAMSCVGLLSALLAMVLPAQWLSLAGLFYFVIGPYFMIAKPMLRKRAQRLDQQPPVK